VRSGRAAASIRLAMEDKIRARYTEDSYRTDPVALWREIEEDQKAVAALNKDFFSSSWSVFRLVVEGTDEKKDVQKLITGMLAKEAQLKRDNGINADSALAITYNMV